MARKIRIECEQRTREGGILTDLRSGKQGMFYRGESVTFELSLFANGRMISRAELTNIKVRILNGGTLLSETIIPSSSLSGSITAQQWRQGVAALALVNFSVAATGDLPPGILTMQVMGTISATESVYASGTIESVTVAGLITGTPPTPTPPTAYSKAESDALFSPIGSAEGVAEGLADEEVARIAADDALNAYITAEAATLYAMTQAGHIGKLTRAELYADLAHASGTIAEVVTDSDPDKNGSYAKVGASGSGYWARSSTDIIARVRALEGDPMLTTQTLGPGTPSSPTATAANYSLANYGTDVPGALVSVSVNVGALNSGGLRIQKIRHVGTALFRVMSDTLVTATATGVNVFTTATHLPATVLYPGEFIAVQSVTSGATLHYKNGTGAGYYAFSGLATAEQTYGSTTPGEIYYNPVIRNSSAVEYAAVAPLFIGAATATNTEYSMMNATQQKGRVTSVSVRVGTLGTGALSIQHLAKNGSTWQVLTSHPVTALATGHNEFVAGTHFNGFVVGPDEYVGIQVTTAGAGVIYDNTAGAGYYIRAGTASGSGLTYGMTASAAIMMGVYFEVETVVSATAAEALEDTGTCPLETVRDFTALPAGWLNETSGWTLSGGKALAVTMAKKLRTGRRYGLSRRTVSWVFSLGHASNVVSFFTDPLEPANPASGSMIKVTATTVTLHNRYDGTAAPAALGSALPLGFTLNVGDICLAEWIKDGRTYTFRLTKLSGNGSYEVTRTAAPWGYSTHPAYGYDQGTMQGAPGVMWDSGGATGPSIYSMDHIAEGSRRPKLYIGPGDSITEGFGVPDASRWAQRVALKIGEDRVHISGIGGATATNALTRMQDELLFMRPEYVMIYLGTNFSSGFAANMAALAAFAQSIGAGIITCTIPTQAGLSADVLALTGDHVRFDTALYSGGLIAAKYASEDAANNPYNDSLHPNSWGHQAMADRVFLDVPALLE